MGRPKTWFFDKRMIESEKAEYRKKQMDTVLQVTRAYSADIPVVMNLSIGHTDPQLVLPFVGSAKIDPKQKRLDVKSHG
jgi:muramoyltetrapeptide carboxypeptidase LdcA involved in peptidoglycan recycling